MEEKTIAEKVDAVNRYMDEHWGSWLAEELWHKTCECVTDDEVASLYDLYREYLEDE